MNGPNDAGCGCEDCQDKGGMRQKNPRMDMMKQILKTAMRSGDTSKEEQIRRLIAEAKGRM